MPAMMMGIGTAVSAGGSIFSGIFGSSAAKKQAEAIKYAADQAKTTALEMNQRARDDVQPFRDMGVKAGNTLTNILFGGGNTKDVLQASDLFKFQSDLGSRNINRDLMAKGLYGSGAGLEALSRFNNQLVGEEGQRLYDRLMGVTQLGSNAAMQQAANTTSTGNAVSQMQANMGVQYANSIGDAGRAIAGMGQGVAGALNTGLQNYTNYSLYQPIMDAYAKKISSGGASGGSGGSGFSLFSGG